MSADASTSCICVLQHEVDHLGWATYIADQSESIHLTCHSGKPFSAWLRDNRGCHPQVAQRGFGPSNCPLGHAPTYTGGFPNVPTKETTTQPDRRHDRSTIPRRLASSAIRSRRHRTAVGTVSTEDYWQPAAMEQLRAKFSCHCGHSSWKHEPTRRTDTTWHCVPECLCIGYKSAEYVAPAPPPPSATRPATKVRRPRSRTAMAGAA